MKVYIWGEADRYPNYQRAVKLAGGTVCFGGDADVCDALLLPGGGDLVPGHYGQDNIASYGLEPERDAAEFALLELFSGQKKPVLGICRGMQTINVFFGGTLTQDIPGHTAVSGEDRYHSVKTADSWLLPLCGETVSVNSAHHQAVDRLGSGLIAAQWALDGVIEGLCHRTLPVWAVQWHPERLGGMLGTRIFQTFLQRCEAQKNTRGNGIIY